MFAPWRSQKSVHKQKEFISATYSKWSGLSACVKWSMTKQRSSITQRIISFPQQGSPIGVVCFACGIFHIIGNPLNCSDTAKRVTKAMIGTKVITRLRFAIFVLFLLISRQNSSLGSSAFSHLGNRAEFSHINPRRNSSR